MDFLTSTILSGIAWDSIKILKNVSIHKLKSGLRDWILNEEEYETIANEINSAPEIIRTTPDLLKAYIDSNKHLINILSSTKPTNSLTQSNNTFKDSPNQQGNYNTQNNNYSQPLKPYNSLGKSAEILLKEMLDNEDHLFEYIKERFSILECSRQTDRQLRSVIGELTEKKYLNCIWADDIPYSLSLTHYAKEYF